MFLDSPCASSVGSLAVAFGRLAHWDDCIRPVLAACAEAAEDSAAAMIPASMTAPSHGGSRLSDAQIESALFKPCRDIEKLVRELSRTKGNRICAIPEGPQVIPYLDEG